MLKNHGIKILSAVLSAAMLTVPLGGCFLFDGNGNTPPAFTLSESELSMFIGENVLLDASMQDETIWISEDESIATVEAGLVTALAEGETTVYALNGNQTAECFVTVSEDYGTDDPELKKKGFKLVWHDEFDGDSLNDEYWSVQTGTRDDYYGNQGPANWGNNEMQSYGEDNVRVSDGNLIIIARKEEEKVNGKSYTSGRITSRGKITTTFGYVEARMKLPTGDGLWPAFWMLPQPSSTDSSHNEYGGWAKNGEIDIMEAKGRITNAVGNALHFGGGYGSNDSAGTTVTLDGSIDGWHTYAVEWRADGIDWFVDGVKTFSVSSSRWWTAAVPSEENPVAPFDKPFYILFNLAVGGTYDPTGTENLKQSDWLVSEQLLVDYVRVYSDNGY